MIGRSDALHNITYNIDSLDSNTAYQIIVQAIGTLGSTNSTTIVLYTIPNKVQGKLPATILKVYYNTTLMYLQ